MTDSFDNRYWISANYGASWKQMRCTTAQRAKKVALKERDVTPESEIMLGKIIAGKIVKEWIGLPVTGVRRHWVKCTQPLSVAQTVTPVTK